MDYRKWAGGGASLMTCPDMTGRMETATILEFGYYSNSLLHDATSLFY